MRVIILGCGRVGSTLARILSEQNHEVTIIDQTADAFRRLGSKFKGTRITGDGMDRDVLERAGLRNTDVFVSVTSGDNRNIMAAQVAKEVFNVPKVLTRVYDPSRAKVFHDMGIHTICTTTIAAGLLCDLALDRPNASLLESLQAGGEAGITIPTATPTISPSTITTVTAKEA